LETPNQAVQRTAGQESFFLTTSHQCPAAAELGRSAKEARISMRRPRGEVLAIFWGRTYATWAALKLMYEMLMLSSLCIRHPIANFAMLAALWELVIGVGTCKGNTRRMAAIAGTVTNLGLIAFAFIADAWQLPWEGCGCVFIGIEFPWLPGHAIFAGVLMLPFLAVVCSELRRQSSESTAEPGAVADGGA